MSPSRNNSVLEQPAALPKTVTPKTKTKSTITLIEAVSIIVGLVIGAGIFETPALVAANVENGFALLLTWLAGGLVSLIGALCYAELATTYPHAGGNYYYLLRAFGENVAFLFAWARMTVVQTGSIALLAFVFGDYAAQFWRLGTGSSFPAASVYAALAVVLLTALNLLGLKQGKQIQNWLTVAKVLGLLAVVAIGLAATTAGLELETAVPAEATAANPSRSWGLAMLFVLLSYGGWSEAAYISAEIRHYQRNIVRSLCWSVGIITLIYGAINLAYLNGLGLAGMAQSEAIAADLLRQAVGEAGAIFVSLLIAVSTLGAINATILTGARTNYALGQDFPLFSALGHWQPRLGTSISALLVQGAITLALIGLGTLTRGGFGTMVDYTAPIFWFFFLLTGISLLVLRSQEPQIYRPFKVPLYPVLPLAFCGVCGYLLYSSIAYTGWGAVVGLAVLGCGLPLLLWNRHFQQSSLTRNK
ncbi:amino acid permease [Leptolyngbya sp. BC1307]|uniref:APC family permease n=1 Tax=Leptolyngbya sp. BC1307 TaxID=2029589 RepID=UPI000EFD7D6B|nr:amino acid permease [Leptolyngbya sp. BC1307]